MIPAAFFLGNPGLPCETAFFKDRHIGACELLKLSSDGIVLFRRGERLGSSASKKEEVASEAPSKDRQAE